MRWAKKGADYLPYTYYIENGKNTMRAEEKQKDMPPLIMILTMVDEEGVTVHVTAGEWGGFCFDDRSID